MVNKLVLVVCLVSVLIMGIRPGYATKVSVSTESELEAGIDAAQPGDTIMMATGVWKDIEINLDGNGTTNAPIVLMAEILGQVLIEGNSSLDMGGSYLVVNGLTFQNGQTPSSAAIIDFRSDSDCNNCRLTNTSIIDFNSGSDNQKWVSLYGEENRVDHSLFKGKTDGGTLLVVWLKEGSGRVNHLIDHNQFLDRPDLGANGGEIMRLGDSKTSMQECGTVVEYNYFENCDGEIEIISNKSGFNIYRYNTFYNNDGQLTLRHGNDCRVEGNFFFGNNKSGSSGVRVIGDRHVVVNNYFQDLQGDGDFRAAINIIGGVVDSPLNRYFNATDATVAFNTIVNCKSSISIGGDGTSGSEVFEPPVNCTIANNLIYNGSSNDLIDIINAPVDFKYVKNLYEANSLGAGISGWESTDLSLTDVEVNGYTLKKLSDQSPAIDASDEIVSVTHDMDGQSRNNPDVGSDEFSTAEVTITPLNKELTGPALVQADFLYSSDSELQYLAQGEMKSLKVSSNIEWTASTEESWIAIDKTGASGSEELNITVQENTDPLPRKGKVTLTGGIFTSEVEISQLPADIDLGGEKLTVIKVTATAEQVDGSNANSKENAVDGDLNTRWSAEGEQSITFEIEDKDVVSYFKVAFHKGDERTSTIQIDVSEDNSIFTNVVAKGQSSGVTSDFEFFDITDTEAKFVRITGFGNSVSDWNSISEVEIWGEKIPVLGLDNRLEGKLSVYPNPSKDTLLVEFGYESKGLKIEIIDLLGRQMSSMKVDGKYARVDTGSLMNGIYLLKVSKGSEKLLRRIQVRR
ncbi:MAG: discoidin domain-containing protein [Cyclobacteriaceae bacterium]